MTYNSKIDQVVQIIREQIEQGIYSVGQRLPSERDLAEELQISRSTIRAALLRLQAENLIDIVPRGGAFVRSSAPKIVMGEYPNLPKNKGPELKQVGSFIHMMREQGREVLVRYLEPSSIIPAGEEVGRNLGVDAKEKVLRRFRVQLVDRVPYRILDTYLLASLMGELVGQEDHKVPLFKWLWENKKIRASRVLERLNCRMPTADEAAVLHIARNQPVMEMHRWIWGQSKKEEILFEYSRIVCNASLHELQYTYNIEEEISKWFEGEQSRR
ncbi:GntR family transcriptional regulator [Lihuaxuella thermophila]|uniref:DNA-binding transcriptional regulator, GntR family n=1 Tax=Lihuaxuella thermophila TaxID=1173111 RepID=A0A1H8GX23_9BACL|nr:GntR family transcriptional regulator [Lihuaxuella thermophila]SEN48543.1 DNA-binding transcriptional regulator, GntR family [Lihuaxuella thermophila]